MNIKTDLDKARLAVADQSFAEADFGDSVVGETGGWTIDGNFYSIKVFWEQEDGPSVIGSYGVEFAPESDQVIDTWHQ